MKKKFLLVSSVALSLLIIGLVFVSCKTNNKSNNEDKHSKEFVDGLEEANKRCPIVIPGGAGSLDAIKLEDDYVTFYVHYNEETNPLFKDGDKVKEALIMLVLGGNNQSDFIVDMIIKENCGLKLVATEADGKKISVAISPDELTQYRDKFKQNPQESTRRMLEMQLEAERASLPMIIEEGMTMTDFSLEGDNLVFTCEVDERIYSIDEFKGNEDIIKDEIVLGLKEDPQSKLIVNLCKTSNMDIVYRMVGDRSKRKVDVIIPCEEL